MAQISQSELQIVIKALDQASGTMRAIGNETEGLAKKTSSLEGVMRAASAALAAYAGSQGLGFLIRAVEESNMMLAQARFFLTGFGKNIDENYNSLRV
ncbi:MAG TPA: hypothetical protein VEF04_21980, partial [Blastocatellia bacterium]|nr:hypothetical protein [Blastocatellia bacterium]